MSVQLNRGVSGSISIERTDRSGSVGQASNEYGISQSESSGTRATDGAGARRGPLDAIKSFFKAVGNFFKNLFSGGGAGAPTTAQTTTTQTTGPGRGDRFDVSPYRREGTAGFDTGRMMRDVLEGTNPDLDRAFTAYCKGRYSDESLDFLKAVHAYKSDPTPEKAQEIVDEFIDGDRRVNPHDKDDFTQIMFRQAKERLADGAAPVDAFAEVEAGVYDMTQHDLMGQFAVKQSQGG
jgi:hypothetical protein